MPIYISILRGINVGGHKLIKMERLRASLQDLGLEQVQTYIQSGNVVFRAPRVLPDALSRRIERKILSDFGFSVSVISRTAGELRKIIASNPFLGAAGIDQEKLHVMFLSEPPSADARKKLEALKCAPDRSCCLGSELYLYLPNGTAKSTLMKNPLDRLLRVVSTTRNWRTVNTLHQMCEDCG